MPPTPPPCPVTAAVELSVAAANERLRAYVRAHGDRPWTQSELGELARLRGAWLAARAGLAEAA
ncbi:hypothetical protein [Actinacidiphila oryziradicis]|uniref:hypothetical protein n=1 Tax=Actinacidiphila oryziradicis TaxID=2571141 RepID=UPI0023F51C48|nr:hypothetical protein [Actinacidiphila oryziradicis]